MDREEEVEKRREIEERLNGVGTECWLRLKQGLKVLFAAAIQMPPK